MSNDQPAKQTVITLILFVLALSVAFWFRFDQIEIKPFHHDEGVNSYFLLNLTRNANYKYDPTNYHGPTLYYLGLFSVFVFGESDLALRFWPALFGVLTVGMTWVLRRHLGPVGTPVAAFFLALSPGLVYFSRDFIHEMSFGSFSLGVVLGAWRYAETKKFAWLALMSISAAMLFATKETAIITIAVFLIALVCASIWDSTRKIIHERSFSLSALIGGLTRDGLSVLPSPDHLLAALVLFLSIDIFFYSSVFTNMEGVPDALKSILLWTQRSGAEHVKSFWYYLGILIKLELPMLAATLPATVFVIWRGTRFWLFVAAWTLGITLAYSIIGYKTPWLMVNFLIPLALLGGYAAQQLYLALNPVAVRILLAALIITVLLFCGRLTAKVNFDKYDDNSNSSGYFTALGTRVKFKPYIDGQYGYVYAQTDRDILNLVKSIEEETEKLPSGQHTGIYIASPDYWPLPWYLRDYDQVAYTGSLNVLPGQKPAIAQPVVIAGVNQQAALNESPGWRSVGRPFILRPGVELVLYVRDELNKNIQ